MWQKNKECEIHECKNIDNSKWTSYVCFYNVIRSHPRANSRLFMSFLIFHISTLRSAEVSSLDMADCLVGNGTKTINISVTKIWVKDENVLVVAKWRGTIRYFRSDSWLTSVSYTLVLSCDTHTLFHYLLLSLYESIY